MGEQNANYRSGYRQNADGWKWLAGATAATAALGSTAAQASMVTINLVGNYISAQQGNHLNADLTGDGMPDITVAGAMTFNGYVGPSNSSRLLTAAVSINGVYARAVNQNNFVFSLQLGSQRKRTSTYRSHPGSLFLSEAIPVVFKDLHINGGARRKGLLTVTVSGLPGVQLDSLTYQTPDQGSTLAFLAMVAGGIVALRRWKVTRAA